MGERIELEQEKEKSEIDRIERNFKNKGGIFIKIPLDKVWEDFQFCQGCGYPLSSDNESMKICTHCGRTYSPQEKEAN